MLKKARVLNFFISRAKDSMGAGHWLVMQGIIWHRSMRVAVYWS